MQINKQNSDNIKRTKVDDTLEPVVYLEMFVKQFRVGRDGQTMKFKY